MDLEKMIQNYTRLLELLQLNFYYLYKTHDFFFFSFSLCMFAVMSENLSERQFDSWIVFFPSSPCKQASDQLSLEYSPPYF